METGEQAGCLSRWRPSSQGFVAVLRGTSVGPRRWTGTSLLSPKQLKASFLFDEFMYMYSYQVNQV